MPSTFAPDGSGAAVPGFVHRRLPASVPAASVFVTFLISAGLFGGLTRLIRLGTDEVALHDDVRLVWFPLARTVADGTPLYTRAATDNKPPLFELVNLGAYLTDHYVLVLLLVVGLTNGLAAAFLWRTCATRGYPRVGALSALVFLWTLQLVDGTAINVRSLTVAGVLFALATRRPETRGVGVACAVLCSQHAVFALPVVAYDGYVLAGRDRRWLVRFALSGVLVVGAVYAAVLAVWGVPSLVGALEATVGTAGPYLLEFGPSVWMSTATWGLYTVRMHLRLWVVLALAVWGLWRALRGVRTREWDLAHLVVATLVALSVPLVVRPFVTYWIYPLPAISVLAAEGVHGILSGAAVLDGG